jgi:hypothetical protein
MYTVNIPDNLARTVIDLYGEAGRAWLARLPSLVGAYARQWALTVLPPFEPLSYNYVVPAVLSAWWSLEDHGHGWEWGIACAELLAQLQ